VRGGLEFDAAVSFHGLLQSRPSSSDMVCNGVYDLFKESNLAQLIIVRTYNDHC
jgi:hypothetical protein